MKIALIGNEYVQQFPLEGYGGIEASVEAIAWELWRRDTPFFVVVPKKKGGVEKNYPFKIIETMARPSSIEKSGTSPFINGVRNILEENTDFDVIWSQSHWSVDPLISLGRPIISTFHDSIPRQSGWMLEYPLVRYRFVSQSQRSIWAHEQWELNNSFVAHLGVNPEEYFAPVSFSLRNDWIWVGGLNWGPTAKGLDLFIRLAQLHPQEKFTVYGTGNQAIEDELIRLSNLIPNLRYLGSLQRGPNHSDAFRFAKGLIFPTRIPEAFGRVVVEAISKGTPVIGANHSSLLELIDPTLGELLSIDLFNPNLSRKYDYQEIFIYSYKFHIRNEVDILIQKSQEFLQNIK